MSIIAYLYSSVYKDVKISLSVMTLKFDAYHFYRLAERNKAAKWHFSFCYL